MSTEPTHNAERTDNTEPTHDTEPTNNAEPTDTAADRNDVLGAGAPRQGDDLQRDPEDWATGDEPMTAAQRSYLDNLAKQAGEQVPADLTKAQASEQIDRLKQQGGDGAAG